MSSRESSSWTCPRHAISRAWGQRQQVCHTTKYHSVGLLSYPFQISTSIEAVSSTPGEAETPPH